MLIVKAKFVLFSICFQKKNPKIVAIKKVNNFATIINFKVDKRMLIRRFVIIRNENRRILKV